MRKQINHPRIAGVVATAPRPTKMAAALVATALSGLFLIVLGMVELLI